MRTVYSKGALTTFIGVVVLAFSQSETFRIFFYMLSGIIIVAMAHGLLLAPAILGECSFMFAGSDQEVQAKRKGAA